MAPEEFTPEVSVEVSKIHEAQELLNATMRRLWAEGYRVDVEVTASLADGRYLPKLTVIVGTTP